MSIRNPDRLREVLSDPRRLARAFSRHAYGMLAWVDLFGGKLKSIKGLDTMLVAARIIADNARHAKLFSDRAREQYARAGLRMLPAARPRPRVTAFMAVMYALVLLPVSLLPSEFGLAGNAYAWTALVLGLGYLLCALRFLWNESTTSARGLLWSSLVYLPLLLLVLTWDHFQLLR